MSDRVRVSLFVRDRRARRVRLRRRRAVLLAPRSSRASGLRRARLIGAPAVLLSLGVLQALAPSAQGAVAPGIVINGPRGLSPPINGYANSLGVPWVRMFVSWASFEPTRGQLTPGEIGGLEAGMATLAPGTRVVLDVLDAPRWASGASNPATPPRNVSDYAAFVSKLARRLDGRVAAWEIWNEEDETYFWSTGPDPARYTELLRAAYKAIKRVDKHTTVLVGGLTGNNYEYLQALYKDGAKGSFDAVGVHTDDACHVESPYEYEYANNVAGRFSRWSFLGYRTVHAVMLANHDPKPIWMTELGWSTYPGSCDAGKWAGQKPGGVSPEVQATYLRQAYHCLAQDSYVQVGIWFGLQDLGPGSGSRGTFGLLNDSLGLKPAFSALANYQREGDTLKDACGDFNGPSISVARPTRGAHLRGALTVVLSASDPFGVQRITLETDRHHHVRTFTTHPAKPTLKVRWWWWNAGHLRPGRHVLKVLAVDERGNVSTSALVIWRAGKLKRRHR